MILFWFLAGLVASAAALLILLRASRAEQASGGPDPRLEVYRRQLAEIDDLAERRLLGEEEHRAAKAEAGRRLLGEAEHTAPAAPSAGGRRAALAGAILAPTLALVAYLLLGSPGLPDQPYKARLKAWREAANTDPGRLNLDETAAVLEAIAAERPTDPQPWIFLGRLRAAQGDSAAAIKALGRAASLKPRDPEIWSILGQTQVALADNQVTPEAREAFEKALALDPKAAAPRYFLARADIAAGKVQAGLQAWQALAADLPAADPRRAELLAEAGQVSRTGGLAKPAAEAPAGEGAEQAAFIQSMVNRLAARLKAQPDDPEGWARLIRAYGVLGQSGQRDEAIAAARRLFKDRPADLKTALSTAP